MILFKKATDLRNWLDTQQKERSKIGFVPTMGALHQGHISLIEAAKNQNSITVCSIFINPTQFNDPVDFKKYPVTLENDIYLLAAAGCDALFLPSVEEIYPKTGKNEKPYKYEFGNLENILEGKYRPGHFQGVGMVVHRLLGIVRPTRLYLGQKDYQQCMIIRKLIELIGLKESVELVISPTLREPGGLAMSSRNMRLDKAESEKAMAISKNLHMIKEKLREGDLTALKKQAQENLEKNGFRVDYVEIADADSLERVENWDGKQKLVALAAAYMNEVRLIDNLLLT
jgi:pantoate--beta-alanine ligase